MEPCSTEGMAGHHRGGRGKEGCGDSHCPCLCFSWLHKRHFCLSSTAAKNNHLKLMAYVSIKLLNLHWSLLALHTKPAT